MDNTVLLSLPLLANKQALQTTFHDEALKTLDALVMLSVIDRDLSSPPPSPEEGDRYIVKAPGSGDDAWVDDNVIVFVDGGWRPFPPRPGWTCYVQDEDALIAWDGSAWRPAVEMQNLAVLGVGTEADAANPFAAKLNNALWSARYAGEGGDGDLRYKLNKEAAGNTLSMLFQTDWSGRGEIGLTGDDDFHFKVSDDGTTWRDGIVIEAATGKVSFPQGAVGVREKLTAARTYYVRTDGDDANDGLANTSGGAFATVQKGVDVVFGTLDLGGFDVIIQLDDGNYAGAWQESPQVGAGLVTIRGNMSNPENVVVTSSTGHNIRIANGARLHVEGFQVRTITTSGTCLRAENGAFLTYANMHVGPSTSHQIRANDLGRVTCTGNYSIVGNGSTHWNVVAGGVIRCQARTVTLVGTPSFSSRFIDTQLVGMVVADGNTFSGSATGSRYNARENSVIFTNGAGASYLPGNSAGVSATGGQYI